VTNELVNVNVIQPQALKVRLVLKVIMDQLVERARPVLKVLWVQSDHWVILLMLQRALKVLWVQPEIPPFKELKDHGALKVVRVDKVDKVHKVLKDQ